MKRKFADRTDIASAMTWNLAFADDTGNLANSRESASFLVSETTKNFNRIGLEINVEKSVAIIIENGKLSNVDLFVDKNKSIRALGKNI